MASILLIGLPNYLILSCYLCYRWHQINASSYELAFLYLAISWIWIGSLLIWYYEERLLNNFFRESRQVIHHKSLRNIYFNVRQKHKKTLITLWTLVVLGVYIFVARDYCNERLGMQGFTDPLYVLSILSVGIQALLNGIGFYGCINMTLQVWNIYKSCDLVINPYHLDKKVGLSVYSDLSLKTTAIFSSGTIYLPILLIVANSINKNIVWGIYILTVMFSVFISLSFFIPNYFLYKKCKLIVRKEAQKIVEKLNPLYNRIINDHKYADNVVAEYNMLRQVFQDLMSIELYPFNLKVTTYLASAVLFPFLMVLAKIFIPKWMGIDTK